MKAKELTFDNICIGDSVSFTKVWTKEDVSTFSMLCGDTNPLHLNEDYAMTTDFKKPIVHGMLVSSSFSTLVGMYLPGKYCLYLKQDILFKKPVYINDILVIEGSVVGKIQSVKTLEIKTRIFCNNEVVIDGVAMVKVLDSHE